MKELSLRNQELISRALKTVGLSDPEDTYAYIVEECYVEEAKDIHDFIVWLHKTGKPYGSVNAQLRWKEYKEGYNLSILGALFSKDSERIDMGIMDEIKMKKVVNKLRVVHFPQLGYKGSFTIEVPDEIEAYKIMTILAIQHLWLEKNRIIPDYSNAIFVEMWDDNEWCNYWNEEEQMDWEELEETYLKEIQIVTNWNG